MCFVLLSLSVSLTWAQDTQSNAPRLNDADAIRLAVFQELVGPWLRPPTPDSSGVVVRAFYFAIENKKDPSDSLLQALGPMRLPTKKASASFISRADGDVVLDKKTKKPGILFSIYKLTWTNPDEAQVEGGNYEGNMSAYGCTYTLKKEDGAWRIAKQSGCSIS